MKSLGFLIFLVFQASSSPTSTEESIPPPTTTTPSCQQSETPSLSPRDGISILERVNQEVKRLGLDFSENPFEHSNNPQEDARALIRQRKQALASTIAVATSTASTSTSSSDPASTTTAAPAPAPGLASVLAGVAHTGASTAKKGASLISGVFGGERTPTTKPTTTTPTPTTTAISTATSPTPERLVRAFENNCSDPKKIFFQGECRNIFGADDLCPPGQWLIEDPTDGQGTCAENPCHASSNTAKFGDSCVRVGSDRHCAAGMRTYIDRSGRVECDCKEGHLYHPESGKCYEAFRRGPCPAGQYYIIPKEKKEPLCLPNPCNDGYFCNAPKCRKQVGCDRLGGPCEEGNSAKKYGVHAKLLTVTCYIQEQFKPDLIIGNVPTLNCAPGSRRDILGNCRTPSTIDFDT